MNYTQISATLATLTALYSKQTEIYSNWSPARQGELDQVKSQIEALEVQYGELKK